MVLVSTLDGSGARRVAMRLVLGQVATTAAIAAICLIGFGTRAAISAVLGGGTSVAASLVMAWFMFRGTANGDPQKILRGVSRGEAAKLAITVLLLVMVVRSGMVDALPMLTAFIGASFVYWFALLKS